MNLSLNSRCVYLLLYIPWVYLPGLLERVSAVEVLGPDSNLSTCINFTVFSVVMAYNNKNVGGLFGCNFTLCVPNH